MRDARDAARLLRRIVHWLPDIEALARLPNGERALEPLLRYIALVSPDLQLEQIRAILEDHAPTAEGITMTIAEKLMAEGRAKGRAEGEAKGKAEAVVLVLRSRGLHVDAQLQARLASMSIEDLDASLQRAATVASVDELLDT
jgi:flagellar biosynthesis/type III secretory pathway protein FliH